MRVMQAAGFVLAVAAVPGAAAAQSPKTVDVTYPASIAKGPLDGRLLLLLSTDDKAEPRLQISDTSLDSQQVFGIDVDGWKPGDVATFKPGVLGLPGHQPGPGQAGNLLRAGAAAPLRDLQALGRPHREAPHGPRRGPAVEPRPGQPLQHAEEDRRRGEPVGPHHPGARPGHPGDQAARGHEVRQARADPQRAAVEVLGTRHVPGRARPAAGGLGHPPAGEVPAGHQPRALPRRLRRLPAGPARPQPEVRVLRPLPPRVLQPDRAGARAPVLQGLDGPRLPARAADRDPAREPVLRRLVRRELRQPGPVRRRHHVRADPLSREEVPRAGRRLGALHVRRVHGRLGGDGRAGLLPRRVQRRLDRLPRSDRLPRLHGRGHLQGHERVLVRGSLEEGGAAGPSRLPGPPVRRRSSR